jgi:hypothetical protein
VIKDRVTASDHSPSVVLRLTHSRQNVSVVASDRSGSMASGGGRCDAPWVNTNGTVAPSVTSNSATVFKSTPRTGTGVCKRTISGPETARNVPSAMWSTHGTPVP